MVKMFKKDSRGHYKPLISFLSSRLTDHLFLVAYVWGIFNSYVVSIWQFIIISSKDKENLDWSK